MFRGFTSMGLYPDPALPIRRPGRLAAPLTQTPPSPPPMPTPRGGSRAGFTRYADRARS